MTHVLPAGFVRVRHYGLLANRGRAEKLQQCRRLLGLAPTPAVGGAEAAEPAVAVGPRRCPVCGQGTMAVVEVLAAWPKGGCGGGLNSS